MVKQFVWQSPLRCPGVCLWVIAFKIVRVLNDIMAVDVSSASDEECVIEHCGRVVHPSLLQVGTLDEPVGLGVICNHSSSVSCDREDINMRRAAHVVLVECRDVILQTYQYY